ncbi:polysaccharide pyruvyl transferase family protein [Oceanihabitans sp. 2_MG-2023]|uniref:polysaccharide pyruvyl transferase family protein n=1 Tax=Oceanihabitans sp. 2_MG-2023 TaxID=3062661 RepID=UPI0026E3C52B|nr:polysaccharide pyruvyl transferase family protein [Oceanihabitans sp. 2_MG-2023]MDO6597696.1 polysaccharide pyruvyl transferase family protein [Oceanihabitans sp. 2_MG-2023]
MLRKHLSNIYGFVRNKFLDIRDGLDCLNAKVHNRKIVYSLYARVNNFGDQFNKDLLRYFERELIYVKSAEKSQAVFTGSILGNFPVEYSGYILGAGFLLERYKRLNNNWNILILRGPLSAMQCGEKNALYADPGILASNIYKENVAKRYDLGIIPNGREKDIVLNLKFGENVLLINPHRNAKEVIKDIKSCKCIASSSLHGLIFADSFRIPNIHLYFSDKVLGGYHKFIDYYLGMDTEHQVVKYNPVMSSKDIIGHCKLHYTQEYLSNKQKEVIQVYNRILEKI